MTYELWVLALNAVVLLVLYGMQGADTVLNAPAWGLVGARDQDREGSDFTGRARRTVKNQIEAVAVFAPLVLIAHMLEVSNTLTVWGAGLFLGARVLYVPLYLPGAPFIAAAILVVVSLMIFSFATRGLTLASGDKKVTAKDA